MVERYRKRGKLGPIDAVGQYVLFPANGLVSYYKLDETTGTSVADSFGSNTGTATNVSWAAGKINNAGSFNGTTSYITLPQTTAFDITTGTFSFWIKLNSTSAGIQTIFDHWDETTGSGNWAGFKINFGNSSTSFYADAVISNATNGNATTNSITWGTVDTNWHLLTIRIADGNKTYIYFDGTLISSKTDHSTVNYSTNPVIYIGANKREYGGTLTNVLNGLIDEVGIWNRALTQDEITTLYNNGAGLTYNP